MVRVKLEGWNEVINNWKNFETSPERALPNFLNIIEFTALNLLKQNTPVDTGALRDSWHTLEKTMNTLEIGVTDDQEAKLRYNVMGTSVEAPNPFMDIVTDSINNLIDNVLETELIASHPMWAVIKGRINMPKVNISKTTGLTGTKISSRRFSGSANLRRPASGRVGLLNRRFRLPRHLGTSILSKTKARIR